MATVKTPAKKAAKTENTKADKFVSLGQKRVGAAIHKIRLVRNLANTASYEFTAEQVAAIQTALAAEVESLIARFEAALSAPTAKAEKDAGFTF